MLPTAERSVVVPRLTSLNHVDVIGAEDDVQDISDGPITPHAPVWGAGRPEQQLATLAVRLEMTAVYLRLVRGQVECTCHAERYGPCMDSRAALAESTGGPSPTAHPGN